MKKNTTIISVMLLSLAATIAVAAEDRDRDDDDRGCRGEEHHQCVSAPEIDPAQGLSALMLLAGTVAILRASRVRKNPA
jgi:hypothetical protein